MRSSPLAVLTLLVLGTAGGLGQSLPSASHLISQAETRALKEHKSIWVIFDASW
jgi:hypothetical protein